jgi:uncharacterized protein YsxB (DUF464 family)
MEGNISIALVVVCSSVAGVALGAYSYLSNKFQLKADADKNEAAALLREQDIKTWIRKVENDVSKVQTSLERIGENVSYIRGRLEPNKQSKED